MIETTQMKSILIEFYKFELDNKSSRAEVCSCYVLPKLNQ